MNIKTLLWTYIVKPIKNLGGDKSKIRRQWKQIMGYDLDLSNPRTFNEKIQYLKLLERKPEYTVMVDKYAAKQWIADRVGEEYVPKLLGVWNRAEDIDFDALPQRFVLKTTHDSGGVIVVKDKNLIDKGGAVTRENLPISSVEIKEFLRRHLKDNHYARHYEWVYKHVKHKIIAEEFLPISKDSNQSAFDYKIFCFNGQPKFLSIERDRFGEHFSSYYSTDNWKKMPFNELHNPENPAEEAVPENLEEMLSIARKLSIGLPLLRVDLFLSGDRPYVGELTFFHGAGFERFAPEFADIMMGDMIDLSAWREYSGGIYLYIKKLRSVLGLKGI